MKSFKYCGELHLLIAAVIAIPLGLLLGSALYAQQPPMPPAPPTQVQPAQPTVVAPSPIAPVAQNNPINYQTAVWIADALEKLKVMQTNTVSTNTGTTLGNSIRATAANHPTASLLILLRGLFGIVLLPIHTILDRFLQRKLSPRQYAAIHTQGSTVYKQFDWLVNLLFSIKPSVISAAAKMTTLTAVAPQDSAAAAPEPVILGAPSDNDARFMPAPPSAI